ncbi:DUF4215 domain-containing protein [Haliangium sp.]|uniref:DUF4215 domain-containing protein n=1 Tax=Haliangium sp. TaxID=2663208 RepID=UPI003D0DCBAD
MITIPTAPSRICALLSMLALVAGCGGPGLTFCDDGSICPDAHVCALGSEDGHYQCVPIERCGDGARNVGEDCDDGNLIAGDGCSELCRTEVCGNAVVDYAEECDDGNTAPGDGCDGLCRTEACGNARVDIDEQCDDDNTTPGDGCSPACTIEECGNGVVDIDEECDDGNIASGDGCSDQCQAEVCGNARVDAGELCDDGNTAPGDGCSDRCEVEDCGNERVDYGEACDDGNHLSGDGCSYDCTRSERCGDGVLACGEQCDDGNDDDTDTCTNTCRLSACLGGGDDGACAEPVCEGVYLSELVLSGPTASSLDLDPTRTQYIADVSLLQNNVSITARSPYPDTTITVAGVHVAAGVPSPPLALDLGENTIDLVVTVPGVGSRTYQLVIRRARAIVQAAYGKASNPAPEDGLGWSVALSGDTLAVGAPYEASAATGPNGDQGDDSAPNSGAVYVFRRVGAAWTQEAYLKASNTGPDDRFGWSVSLSGDTLAVGAPYEASAATGSGGDQADDSVPDSGAVYVFRRAGATWTQEAYLKASNTGPVDNFGWAIAVSDDTLAVGAFAEASAATGPGGDQDDDSALGSGAVYVFRHADATWTQEAYLKASNTDPNDCFGCALALDRDTLAVGARAEASAAIGPGGDQDDDTAPAAGAVYVFRRTDTTWAQEAYLKASNTDPGDGFGAAVALSGDTLAAGAIFEASAATGVDGDQDDDFADFAGAVYVFRRAGAEWTQEAYVKASNTGLFDNFGWSLALSGTTLAVAANGEASAATGIGGDQNDDSAPLSGAVYLFRRIGQTWAQEAYLKASNTGAGDAFGTTVALSGDALAVGAYGEASAAPGPDGDPGDDTAPGAGAVYLFH